MKYINPIIKGFNPDPSICRVGEDYYLVTSSFEYFPGIPIYHSRDLVNWEHIGNCIDSEEQLPMETVSASGGIWAPTIRYDKGIFYVTATFSEKGNFIIYTDNPYGAWSKPVWTEMDGIDPSMFFEDGKMYYCANDCGSRSNIYESEGISLAEMDAKTGKVMGDTKRIWEGTGGGFLEAPHIYHIGEWYYLICAEGGTGLNHISTAARSKNLFGPYESYKDNPILTNRNDTTKQVSCCGHADFVDDTDGNWWAVHLGTRIANGWMSHLGRETFLTPLEWKDGFLVAENYMARINVEAPIKEEQISKTLWCADFSNGNWENEWLFIKKPDMDNYNRIGGVLELKPSKIHLMDGKLSPTFIAVRQADFECSVKTEIDFNTHRTGDEAGLAVYVAPHYSYRIFKHKKQDGDYICVKKTADDFSQTAYCKKIENGTVKLKIKAEKDKYSFYYSTNNEPFTFAVSASTRFLSCELVGRCFTGAIIGVYAQTDTETNAVAKIKSFEQSTQNK